jgi:hypothetical protein
MIGKYLPQEKNKKQTGANNNDNLTAPVMDRAESERHKSQKGYQQNFDYFVAEPYESGL